MAASPRPDRRAARRSRSWNGDLVAVGRPPVDARHSRRRNRNAPAGGAALQAVTASSIGEMRFQAPSMKCSTATIPDGAPGHAHVSSTVVGVAFAASTGAASGASGHRSVHGPASADGTPSIDRVAAHRRLTSPSLPGSVTITVRQPSASGGGNGDSRGASTAPGSVRRRTLSATGRSFRFGTRMIAAASAAVVGAASRKVTTEPMSVSGATCNRIRPGGSPGSEGSRSGAPGTERRRHSDHAGRHDRACGEVAGRVRRPEPVHESAGLGRQQVVGQRRTGSVIPRRV